MGGKAFSQLISENGAEEKNMGGYGSGRSGGRPTVESAFRLDIDYLSRNGLMRPCARVGSVLQFSSSHWDLDAECEAYVGDAGNSWIRLQYEMTDYWTGE